MVSGETRAVQVQDTNVMIERSHVDSLGSVYWEVIGEVYVNTHGDGEMGLMKCRFDARWDYVPVPVLLASVNAINNTVS